MINRRSVLEEEGWTLVYMDSSVKQVKGWWQAGSGAWFGEGSERNKRSLVLTGERSSVRQSGLRGVLFALERRRAGEKMVVVLESEYVFKAITEWSIKWHRQGWRVKSKEIGYRDLWEAIFSLRREAGSLLRFV